MRPFRIIAPFTSIEQLEPLKKIGVDELYCGYVDRESEKRWPIAFHTINRRGKGASFEGMRVFKKAVNEAFRVGIPVFITMNAYYSVEQYTWLIKMVKKLSEFSGIKGLIVADIGLLLTLREMKYEKEIHLSTGGTVLNSATADFFYSMGVNRVILDRQLTIEEIADLVSKIKSNLEVEIFIFNTGCLFIDGYCAFFHCLDNVLETSKVARNIYVGRFTSIMQGCLENKGILRSKNFKVHIVSEAKRDLPKFKFDSQKYPFGCNLCSLYELKRFSGICLKIVERGSNQEKTVRLVSKAIRYLEKPAVTKKQYQHYVRGIYFEIVGRKCTCFDCYCPKHLIG